MGDGGRDAGAQVGDTGSLPYAHSGDVCVPGHWAGVQRGLGIVFQDGGRDGTEKHQLWDSLRKRSFLHLPRGAV